MPLSTPTQIATPWATSGLKNTIPATANPVTGNAGYDQGFPPITMTPKVSGGIPPFGQDMNGALFDITKALQWLEAGGSFPYSSAFSTAIGGYPLGARVSRTDGAGMWVNTVANNTTDPEAGGAGWFPVSSVGATTVAVSGSNVTLTALQYGRPVIILTGTLTANINVVFPAIVAQWTVINATTGAFSITCKTASGSGIAVSGVRPIICDGTNILAQNPGQQIQGISASVAGNALTISYSGGVLDFRAGSLTSGAPIVGVNVPANSITVPAGATLGTTNNNPARLVVLEAYNNGSPVLCVCNFSGVINLDESNLLSPTTISGASNSAAVVYSATSVSANTQYRVVGYVDIVQTTAGTWASAPTAVQGAGAIAISSMASIGFGQEIQNVTGSRSFGTTFYNAKNKPIFALIGITQGSVGVGQLTIRGQTAAPIAPSSTGEIVSITAIIPPWSTYRYDVISGTQTLNSWVEMS